MIIDPAIRDEAVAALFKTGAKIGVRRQYDASRDTAKPFNTAALFVMGGPFEIHASRTSGRMKGKIWVYDRGLLAHEGDEPDLCARVIAAADAVLAAQGRSNPR